MNKKINSVRGMHDYLPEELKIWKKIENIIQKILTSYCYEEIRLPILEKTKIFQRAIGNITDVVEKEMYSFKDKKGNSLTLRPEGTVGCVRAIIENNLLFQKKQRFWYLGPMFRYERPQKGRYRQFYQLGVEVFGLNTPDIDLEIILLISRLWKCLGINLHIKLEINSIGSKLDRIKYQKELVFFLEKYKNILDEDSKKRLYTNPFRILDSKNDMMQKILKKAPLLKNYINTSAINHFNSLCNMMDSYGIKYIHNQNLVRGLDYYNSTVFEWKIDQIGSQNTICAGGRYDSLVQELGGNKTSAIGFAIGIERLVLLIKSLNIISCKEEDINIYIIFIGELNKIYAISLSEEIRNIYPKLKIFVDFMTCSLSKKIKNAVDSLAHIAILIGANEIKKNCFLLKDLKRGREYFFSKSELILKIKKIFYKQGN
ncbi:histidine--tRNA ligase [Buchnera aphidicola]|uniref:Histidine--tRNA ligase n=1 Tax=Buchnera aphidicola subsp. Schizaphis graminum (strain Sg) TaxID=198804 RepID=SYH_BUCAP|nr:histidine--tRNA ligase [Buchnera aphidicola]Q8K9P3.1 RecName: Full=Histidine--tRNA ligase; AltName: Full=Histidyl-tRNA synthetase; Short=HisRS [Buchnera aphidicola str. Sg (Schizaphis graminum)]AAM67835.1 histidyl-tRNA synthetase [Buchnera aphidicola str. Sg (Schizaphis graminum)]AWI49668.1 histidine--tRNA ligase [Buchnera aphidicola (Schizaphis graminum)]